MAEARLRGVIGYQQGFTRLHYLAQHSFVNGDLLDRPVVILDEPTLHLDAATAALVRRAILARCRGRTALVITHDAELAAGADAVVSLREGTTLPAGAV